MVLVANETLRAGPLSVPAYTSPAAPLGRDEALGINVAVRTFKAVCIFSLVAWSLYTCSWCKDHAYVGVGSRTMSCPKPHPIFSCCFLPGLSVVSFYQPLDVYLGWTSDMLLSGLP